MPGFLPALLAGQALPGFPGGIWFLVPSVMRDSCPGSMGQVCCAPCPGAVQPGTATPARHWCLTWALHPPTLQPHRGVFCFFSGLLQWFFVLYHQGVGLVNAETWHTHRGRWSTPGSQGLRSQCWSSCPAIVNVLQCRGKGALWLPWIWTSCENLRESCSECTMFSFLWHSLVWLTSKAGNEI